jgi:hypothetical protein
VDFIPREAWCVYRKTRGMRGSRRYFRATHSANTCSVEDLNTGRSHSGLWFFTLGCRRALEMLTEVRTPNASRRHLTSEASDLPVKKKSRAPCLSWDLARLATLCGRTDTSSASATTSLLPGAEESGVPGVHDGYR